MQSATIIPFPKATPAPLEPATQEPVIQETVQSAGQERLAQALDTLQAALDEQQAAIRDWRFAMAELGIGVVGLSHSLTAYQENLGTVAGRIETLHAESVRLEGWADAALTV